MRAAAAAKLDPMSKGKPPATGPCPVCEGKRKRSCVRCGGSGLVLVETGDEDDLGELDAETVEVMNVYAFVTEHGLAAWMSIHGEMSAEGWRRLHVFKGELDRLETLEREGKAHEERERCRKKR